MECLNFISKVEPNELSAWSALFSAIIALLAFIYAIITVNNWKVQKDYYLNVELLSKMGASLTLLNNLNRSFFPESELDDGQLWVVNDIRSRIQDRNVASIKTLQSGFYNHWKKIENDVVKMRQVAMKAIRFNNNKEIKKFYMLFLVYEAEIFNTIYNYTHLHLSNYSDVYNLPEIKFNGTPLPHPRMYDLIQRGYSPIASIDLLFDNLINISNEDDYRAMLAIYQKYYFTNWK
ncbi:hypothetical protein ACR79M_08495 [Sphingobacterium spiritivorum]|uniref:hypothetical protein n=1 Tax=Sphingobacterium spiritivorum TaxID=258 RepID=UPI003DA595E6